MSSNSEITVAAETAKIQDLLALVQKGQAVLIYQASQLVAKLIAIPAPSKLERLAPMLMKFRCERASARCKLIWFESYQQHSILSRRPKYLLAQV